VAERTTPRPLSIVGHFSDIGLPGRKSSIPVAARIVMEENRAKWLIVGLVATHVLLNAVAFAIVPGTPLDDARPLRYVVLIALFTVGPSQGVLLAVWFAMGGGKFIWRAFATVAGTIVYAGFYLLAKPSTRPAEEWLVFSLSTMVIAIVMLLFSRLVRLRLVRFGQPTPLRSGPFQFYIRDMFLWTTAVALVLGAWQCLPPRALGFLDPWVPLVAVAVFLLVGGVSMFCALGRGWFAVRVSLVPIVAISSAELLNRTCPGRSMIYFMAIIGLMMFWLVSSLLVLRCAGYRLAWRSWRAKLREQIAA
jgi:hypothetical protein